MSVTLLSKTGHFHGPDRARTCTSEESGAESTAGSAALSSPRQRATDASASWLGSKMRTAPPKKARRPKSRKRAVLPLSEDLPQLLLVGAEGEVLVELERVLLVQKPPVERGDRGQL